MSNRTRPKSNERDRIASGSTAALELDRSFRGPLVAYFLDKFRYREGMPPSRIVDEAMEVIQRHTWPGNVRELENAIRRAVILSGGGAITPEHLDMDQARAPYLVDLTEAVRDGRSLASVQAEIEREMIRLAMIQCNQDERAAARLLGIDERA